MKKIGNFVLALIQIIIILALISLICFCIYFFLYRGYDVDKIEEMTGVSFDFTNENITISNQEDKENEQLQNYIITGIEDNNSYENRNSEQIINNSNTEKNYFYTQLNDVAKKIYNVFVENKENLKTGIYEITLPDSITNVLYQTNGDSILAEAFQDSWDAFIYDNTDMFFVDTSKISLLTTKSTWGSKINYKVTIGKGDNINYFDDAFSSYEQVQNAIYELENVRSQMKNQLIGFSNYDKIKKVHDWLVDNLEYDTTLSRQNKHNIYGAFIERKVVCEGYAKALKYILDDLDIPCILVKGIGQNSKGESEKHMWNYVYLDNNWYAIDVTWDDPIIQGGGILTNDLKYDNFLKGSKEFDKNHITEGQISIEGKTFSYPILSINDYE